MARTKYQTLFILKRISGSFDDEEHCMFNIEMM